MGGRHGPLHHRDRRVEQWALVARQAEAPARVLGLCEEGTQPSDAWINERGRRTQQRRAATDRRLTALEEAARARKPPPDPPARGRVLAGIALPARGAAPPGRGARRRGRSADVSAARRRNGVDLPVERTGARRRREGGRSRCHHGELQDRTTFVGDLREVGPPYQPASPTSRPARQRRAPSFCGALSLSRGAFLPATVSALRPDADPVPPARRSILANALPGGRVPLVAPRAPEVRAGPGGLLHGRVRRLPLARLHVQLGVVSIFIEILN